MRSESKYAAPFTMPTANSYQRWRKRRQPLKTWQRFGLFLYRNRLFNAAEYLEFTKRAQQRFPRDFRINWNLATTALNEYPGNSPQRGLAVQTYLVCLSIQPDHPNVLWNVAVAYIHDKKYMLAIEAIEKLLKITPNFQTLTTILPMPIFNLGRLKRQLSTAIKASN